MQCRKGRRIPYLCSEVRLHCIRQLLMPKLVRRRGLLRRKGQRRRQRELHSRRLRLEMYRHLPRLDFLDVNERLLMASTCCMWREWWTYASKRNLLLQEHCQQHTRAYNVQFLASMHRLWLNQLPINRRMVGAWFQIVGRYRPGRREVLSAI